MPAAWRAQGAGQHACAGIPLHDACGEKRTQTSATGTDAGRTLSSVLHAQARVGRRTTMKSCRFFESMAAIGGGSSSPIHKVLLNLFFCVFFRRPDTVFPGKRGGKGTNGAERARCAQRASVGEKVWRRRCLALCSCGSCIGESFGWWSGRAMGGCRGQGPLRGFAGARAGSGTERCSTVRPCASGHRGQGARQAPSTRFCSGCVD